MLVHEKSPDEFEPVLVVCGVLVESHGKVLLLKRHPQKSHGLHWNLPAGKLENAETPLQAARRELFEESGIDVNEKEIWPVGTLYFTPQERHFVFHLFYCPIATKPQLILSESEAVEGRWWAWEEPIAPIIPGGDEVLRFCKKKIDRDYKNSKLNPYNP